jgi:hypothetical protein
MKAYRIYIVGSDGRLQLGEAFEAPEDVAAAVVAEALADKGQTAELWEGGRMVGLVSKRGVFTAGDSAPGA